MATPMTATTPMASATGRSLAYLRWAKYPSDEARRAQMAPASAGRDRRFYDQARQMHPTASPREIERCVASLKSAYYADLSRKRWEKHPPKGASASAKKGGRAA